MGIGDRRTLKIKEYEEDRFQIYRDILKERPEYLNAARITEELLQPGVDTRLYLYAFAPVLTGFVAWVLSEAARSGKKRLYFLSRDGYPMYLAARQMAEWQRLDVECRYLHVSRYSMRVPAYHLDLEKCLDLICVGGIDVTLEKILRRAALSAEEAAEIIMAIGWKDKYQEILNLRQTLELKQTLARQPRLFEYIDRHSREKYGNAISYLDQEGLLSEEPYALVDSGWVGTMQQSIARLVHSKAPKMRVEGYYFGLYELPWGADTSAYHAWYFSPCCGLRRKVYFSNSLFEALCSAAEGMTVEYLPREGRYVPRTVRAGNPNQEQLRQNTKALLSFLEYVKKLVPEIVQDLAGSGKSESEGAGSEISGPRESGSGKLTQRLMKVFMAEPTKLEVAAYGDNLFTDDVLDGNWKRVAAELTQEQIRDQRFLNKLWILLGRRQAEIRESAWIEGSIVRCGGRSWRRNLWHARLYKYFVYARKQIRAGMRMAEEKRERSKNSKWEEIRKNAGNTCLR